MKRLGSTQVLTDEEAGRANEDFIGVELPDAGYSREEELLKRQDELEQKLAQLTDSKNGGVDTAAVDPSKLEKENEILTFIERGSFPVRNPDDLYEYCAVQRDQFGKFGGVHIFKKRAQGWEIVRYGDPEEWGVKSPEGYCVIGDTILMRVRKDIYLRLHRRGQQIADLRRSAADHELRQVGDKARSRGIITTVDEAVDDRQLQRMANRADARRKANAITDKWIREGKMPGVGVPGSNK